MTTRHSILRLFSFFLLNVFAVGVLGTQLRAQSTRKSVAVTVYNNDLGVVREVRTFEVPRGSGEIRMQDVPSRIDPTTVKITDPAHPKDVEIVEQNYEYDLVSQQKLLEKYIDKTIAVTDDKGVKTEGTLLAIEEGKLTLSTANGIVMLPDLARYAMNVPAVSAGLITKPTLVWKTESASALSNEPLEVLYQTAGMTWHAEYIAALSEDDRSLDLTGWVSVENMSGASFPDAKLKLVAGALHRVTPPPAPMDGNADYAVRAQMKRPQFEERGMFEYHIYDLGRQTDINNNQIKQVSLLEANGVASQKRYTYTGGTTVAVTMEFQNSEANHLGMPLPAGIVRVMKRDKDGSLEFVGEDQIAHTPRDEKLTLKVGDAFDLTGTRVITNQQSFGSNSSQETIEITLKNHKDQDVTIDALENVGSNWDITSKSMEYEKKNAYTIVFHVPVKARGEQKVTYTIMHHW